MSKKLLIILPLLAIVLAGCNSQSDSVSSGNIYKIPNQGQCFNSSECPTGYECISDNGSLSKWCTKKSVSGGTAGVIETNPADDTSVGDLNPADDGTATLSSSTIEQANLTTGRRDQSTNNQTPTMPELTIDKNKTYTAIMHTADGDITIALDAKTTPITVNNFVSLANKNFYDNTIFHRVIKGFMIQGGDPKGDGTGGPGYQFADEPFTGEYTRGTIAMANAGPNTNGSQFFIMHADNPLPKNYVIFGKVTSGIDVVDAIAESPVESGLSGESSSPVTPVKILSIDVKE
ncbi:MAG: peptidylprolyl isomerase [Actinomycetota bacterium]